MLHESTIYHYSTRSPTSQEEPYAIQSKDRYSINHFCVSKKKIILLGKYTTIFKEWGLYLFDK